MTTTEIIVPNDPGPVASVDDDPEFHLLLSFTYKRSDVVNELMTFTSAEDCMRYMEEAGAGLRPVPSLILVDINMPIIDGFEMVGELRRTAHFDRHPPMVMLSSSNSPQDALRASEVGADGFFEKPTRILDLVFTGGLST